MKKPFSLTRVLALAACTLALGSCNRTEYAMLPQGESYHGTHITRVTPVAATKPVVDAEANLTAAEKPTAIAAIPEAENSQQATAVPAASSVTVSHNAAVSTSAAAATATSTPKMTRVQRFAASRLLKTASKVAGISQFKQKLDTAKTQRISGYLRTGIVLLLIALIISLFSRVNSVFGLVASILAIIGLVFIVLWLLDNL